VLAALAAFAWPGVRAAAQDEAPEPPSALVASAQERVDELRKRMEDTFLRVQADHARVRTEGFGETLRGDLVAARLDAMVAGVRTRTDLDDSIRMALATAVASGLEHAFRENGNVLPLSPSVLSATLVAVVARCRAEPETGAVDLVIEAAKELLGADDPADAWDEHFQGLDVVVAFRAAHEELEEARKAAVPKVTAADRERDMVLHKREPSYAGPWKGWVKAIAKPDARKRAQFKGLYVDRYEVTCDRYHAFLQAGPARARKELLPPGWKLDEDGNAVMPMDRERHPVTGVTFVQAVRFARAMGKRLPTEDEWEHIAAGSGERPRTYPWGEDLQGRAWGHLSADVRGTSPVDAFPDDTTPAGVVGLAGNVVEFVATTSERKPVPRGRVPKGAQVVVRGGSFKAKPAECITRWRWVIEPDKGRSHVGFRCVMEERDYTRRYGK